jgi:hypothetical protein
LPLLTIHDSIVTRSDSLDIVEAALDKELTHIIGNKPGLKHEHFNKEHAFKTLDDVVKEDWDQLYRAVTSINKDPDWLPSEWRYTREEPLLYRYPVVDGVKMISTRYFPRDYKPYHRDEDEEEQDI